MFILFSVLLQTFTKNCFLWFNFWWMFVTEHEWVMGVELVWFHILWSYIGWNIQVRIFSLNSVIYIILQHVYFYNHQTIFLVLRFQFVVLFEIVYGVYVRTLQHTLNFIFTTFQILCSQTKCGLASTSVCWPNSAFILSWFNTPKSRLSHMCMDISNSYL